jgi:hypothetical protein
MARRSSKANEPAPSLKNRRRKAPAATPEGREMQLISMAYDLAEEQIRNGTVSSQVLAQFIKAGAVHEMLEKEKLKADLELTKAKVEALESAKHVEELYANAIEAMKSYGGSSGESESVD